MAERAQFHVADGCDGCECHIEGVEQRIAFDQHKSGCSCNEGDAKQSSDKNDAAKQAAGHQGIPIKVSDGMAFPLVFYKRTRETGHYYRLRLKNFCGRK